MSLENEITELRKAVLALTEAIKGQQAARALAPVADHTPAPAPKPVEAPVAAPKSEVQTPAPSSTPKALPASITQEEVRAAARQLMNTPDGKSKLLAILSGVGAQSITGAQAVKTEDLPKVLAEITAALEGGAK